MGIKLIILLALLLGVLYCIHLLVQDYQAVTAPRLLRFLFKRDVHSQNYTKPHVRWRRILHHDPIQCARYLYCDLGAKPAEDQLRRGFLYMLTLEPREEDKPSHEVFVKAYESGKLSEDMEFCKNNYSSCPFDSALLFEIIKYLLKSTNPEEKAQTLGARVRLALDRFFIGVHALTRCMNVEEAKDIYQDLTWKEVVTAYPCGKQA